MAIHFLNEDCSFNLPQKRIYKKWITEIIKTYDFYVGEINYVFCSDDAILNINRKFLNHDYYTDIITFPYTLNRKISADIYISIPTVEHNALRYNQTFLIELNRVMAHGVLHLLGFDDKSRIDKKRMTLEENKWINYITNKLNVK